MELFSFFQVVDICYHIALPIIFDSSNFFCSIWELIFFGCVGFGHPLHYLLFGGNCFFRLYSVIVRIYTRCFHSFPIFNSSPITLILLHQPIQIPAPFFCQDGLEEFLLVGELKEFFTQKILENIMSPQRLYRSSDKMVVVLSSMVSGQSIISFSNLNELSTRFFIIRIVLGMVFETQSPVSLFDLVQGSIFWNLENIIIAFLFIGVVLFKEPPLILLHSMLRKKLFESFLCIINRIVLGKHLIIMCSAVCV